MVIIKKIAKRACATILASTILTSMLSLSSISAFATEVNTQADTQSAVQAKVQAEEKAEAQNNPQQKYAGYATGDLTPQRDEYPEDAEIIRTDKDYYNAVYGNSKKDRAAMPLPESCDNSTSKYFPPVSSQGAIGSCVCWAQVYYQYSYNVNKMLNREATYQNTFSPKFAYNLVNGGTDMGSGDDEVYNVLKKLGAPSLESLPYDNDCYSWSFDESVWAEAGQYRLKSRQFIQLPEKVQFVTSADDSDLDAVKAALANGDVLTYSTCIYSWQYSTLKSNPDAPENDKFAGEEVVLCQVGLDGGHRMAIVGYNDNIWTDINCNDKVDDGEMGAFKIVNSWGTNVHNKGFAWVAYDALNAVSAVNGIDVDPERRGIFYGIERIDVERKSDESNIFLKYTVNSATRTKTPIKLVVEKSNTKTEDYLTPYNLAFKNNLEGVERSFNGTQTAADAIFYADLTDYFPELNSDNISDYSISVSFADTQADSLPLTVKSIELVDAYSDTIYRPADFAPFTLDGAEKTVDITESTERAAIVYYNGYYTPNIEYKTQNGSWTPAPGYDMELSYDVDEYTHKYVIPLAENESSALVRFNDGKGSYDTNNNNNYTAYEGLNYFKTPDLPPVEMKLSYVSSMPDDEVIDVNAFYMVTLKPEGGFAPYKYKYSRLDVENGYFYETEFESDSDSNRIDVWGVFPGECVYTFTVEDRLGNQATATANITVAELETGIEYFKINDGEEVYAGDHTVFEILTKHEKGNFGTSEFLIDVYNNDTGERSPYLPYRIERVYKNNCSTAQSTIHTKWMAEKAGNYTAYITIKDMAGKQTTSSVDFKVLKSTGIEIDSFSISPAGKSGVCEKVTMTANASGGTGTLEYKFSYKKDGKEYLIQDYSSKNTATIGFGYNTGEYELIVSVKDSSGKVVTEKKSFTVLPTTLKEIKFSRATAKTGQTVQIIPVIENEASVIKPEHYRYTVIKNGESKILTASSDKTASWTPAEEGEYIITVEVIYDNLILVSGTTKYTVSNSDVEIDKIYFVPSENWKQDKARFAVYAWNDSSKVWASLVEEDGVYSAELSDEYSNVIFCRMNPSKTENNWDNRWNQTADLKRPADKNCFTVNSGEWTGANGKWSVYIPEEPYVSITGDISLTLEETDTDIYTGVAELQAGTYKFNVDDSGTTLGMDFTYTDTATIDYSAGYKSPSKLVANGGRYTFTYNAATKVLRIRYKDFADIVELFGDINVELVRTSADSTVFTGSARVEAGSYTFKINDQGTAMGFGFAFDDVVYNVEYSAAWSSATTFNATGGIYSVKYDTATNKLTFKHAPKGLGDVRIFGDVNIPLASQGNNIYSAQTTLESGTYQFRIDSLGTTVCNGSEFTDVMNGVEYKPDWKAATTFISTEKQKFTFIFDANTNRIKIFNAPIDTTRVLVAFEDTVLILSSTDGVNYTATTTLNAGTYAFRMDEFGVTLGYSGTYTDEIKGIKYNASYSSATTFTATGGDYTFSYNVNTDVLKVTKA